MNKRLQIVFILVFFLSIIGSGQDKKANEDKQLREEILAVYKSGGEQGLSDFVKMQEDRITNEFILDFADAGVKERKEEWLKVCEIIAERQKDAKTLADVQYNTGKYFRLISDFKKATVYLDESLQVYLKLNDSVGQGKIYFRKGEIYLYNGDKTRASDMYEKALPLFEKAKYSQGQGNIYMRKGDVCFRFGDYSKALEMYDKALPFFEKARSPINQGNVYWSKGNIYFLTGANQKALEMYDKALHFYKKVKQILGQGNVYWRKGEIYFYTGDNSRALEMYDKALHFYKKAKTPIGQGNVYYGKGKINFYNGDNSNALKMYDKALTFFEKGEDKMGQGNVSYSKGDLYLRVGDTSKALEMYDKALLFYEKVEDPIGEGNVYRSKGDIYLRAGDTSKALEMYDKALLFYEKMGVSINLGSVYRSKGDIYFYTGNNLKALEMYDKALPFFEKAEEPIGQGNVYIGKGIIYFYTGNDSKALEMYDKALPFYEKGGDLMGQGYVYKNRGEIYFITGDYSKSLEMYDKSLTFFEKAESIIAQGNVHRSKGDIHFNTGDNSRALEMYEKALLFFEKGGDTIDQGSVYLKKGNLYLYTNETSKSLEMYDKALSFFKKAVAIGPETSTLYGKAKVWAKLGKKDKALDLFEKGIANLEKVRRQTAFSELKKTFMGKVYEQYEETVLFMLENKYYDRGFKYAETMRARVFLDRMAEGLVPLEKGLKPELREAWDQLVVKLSNISREMHKTSEKEKKKSKVLKEQYRKVENEFEELLVKIRLSNPLYASVRYLQPLSVQTLQKEVLKKGEIMLRYFISPKKLYVFIISKKKFKVVSIKIKEKEINGLVERYLVALTENNSRDIKSYGSKLYQKLFKPMEKKIKKSREIIIIPDGKLATIPFESLIVDSIEAGQSIYLIQKYRVKYIQSASILSVLRKHFQRDKETKSFIGFGDPVYDYENFKQGKPEQGSITRAQQNEDEIKEIHRDRYARAGGIMNRLPHSGKEIKTIARLFEKESLKSVVHLREQATEDHAKAPNMKDFDYIHFSCHGLLSDDFQSLVLSQLPSEKSKEDGYFTLNEIMNCDYNAKLVVLSACQTGSGKLERAEGVTGMTRAVMYAGTPAVAASLWKVDDEATKELMINFYQNMLEKNLDKTEALRQAKLELIKSKKYRSPLFWSAFVLYGE